MNKPFASFLVLFSIVIFFIDAKSQVKDISIKESENLYDTSKNDHKYWSNNFNISINVDQTSKNEKWTQGGEPFYVSTLASAFLLNKYHHPKYFILNDLHIRFGAAFKSFKDVSIDETVDYFYLYSILGRNISNNFGIGYLNGGQSQLHNKFLSPAYLKTGPIFYYKHKNNTHLIFSPLMGGINLKLGSENFYQNLYGVKSGKRASYGLGAFAQFNTIIPIAKKGLYKTSFTAFTDYTNNRDDLFMDWSNIIKYDFTDYLGVMLNLHLRYCDYEANSVQFSQSMGIGLSYNITSHK